MAFDLKTHIRDTRNGRVARTQPYRMHVSKDPETKEIAQKFERGDVYYAADGTELGPVAAKPGKNAKQAG